MFRNPYKYREPLDPEKDKPVCLPRKDDVDRVIRGIVRGAYWSILGPQRIGKTTFLRQVKHSFPNAYYIYVNFEENPLKGKDFFPWLIARFTDEIPAGESQKKNFKGEFQGESPGLKFYEFLKTFSPRDKNKKVLLLFDEIDRFSFCVEFLRLWRKVYHERDRKKDLKRYTVIITGSVNLIELTHGPGSPFNISEHCDIRDFSNEESEQLVDRPLDELGIKIDPAAKEKLISHISGHPQMLQHACHILVDKAMNTGKHINEKDVDGAIDIMASGNLSLDTLKQQLWADEGLKNLLKDLLNGEKKNYYAYQHFIISGAGPIIERDSYCTIRNRVYERFLEEILAKQENITFKNTMIQEVTQ